MLTLGRPAALVASGRLRRAPDKIVVVIAGPNPSFDYYLAPRLIETGGLPVEVVDIRDAPSHAHDAHARLAGALLLFCRYMSGRWLAAAGSCLSEMAGVGVFLDDDVDTLAADPATPMLYKMRLWRLHLRHRPAFNRICDLVFVSNDVLAERYAQAVPRVLAPISGPLDEPLPRTDRGKCRIVFHASFVHAAEHRWLRPIVRNVLASESGASFEVIASMPQSWWWRSIPGATVAAPLPWPQYRSASRQMGADLLLAPLVPAPGNRSRSWTKRIDAMRLGAAPLVSDANVYMPGPEEESLGMCVRADPAAWTDAIRVLVRDRDRLNRLRDLNRAYVLRESAQARPLVPLPLPAL
jgi:hypothetical protein